jgi:hypothetical protein
VPPNYENDDSLENTEKLPHGISSSKAENIFIPSDSPIYLRLRLWLNRNEHSEIRKFRGGNARVVDIALTSPFEPNKPVTTVRIGGWTGAAVMSRGRRAFKRLLEDLRKYQERPEVVTCEERSCRIRWKCCPAKIPVRRRKVKEVLDGPGGIGKGSGRGDPSGDPERAESICSPGFDRKAMKCRKV